MNGRNRVPRTMLLLCALVPLTFASCGGSTNDGEGVGTETGNPPVIKKEALRLEVTPGGVRLIGTPGAVTPRAEVRITNQRTGTSAATTAAGDGSVDLTISGETSDVYEVTVTRGGREVTVTLTTADLPADLSSLSCEALGNALGNVMAATYAEADTSCTLDSDCAETSWGGDCYFGCGGSVLSASAVDTTAALGVQRIGGLCDEIEARSCAFQEPSCFGPETTLRCEQGQCVARELGDPSTLSCDALLDENNRIVRETLDAVDLSCSLDSDCVALSWDAASCVPGGCPFSVPASAQGRDTALADSSQRSAGVCGEIERRDCPIPVADCEEQAPWVPACEQGRCVAR